MATEETKEGLQAILDALAPRVDDAKARQWEREQRGVFIRSLATEARIPEKVLTTIRRGKANDDDRAINLMLERFRMLVLFGQPGTGKTTSAVRWLFRNADIPKAYFIDAYEYSELKPWAEPYRKAHTCRALVLDDVGREKWGPKPVQWILRDRYNKQYTTTIITTNLTCEKFIRKYGQHIWSRLMEEGDTYEMETVRRKR